MIWSSFVSKQRLMDWFPNVAARREQTGRARHEGKRYARLGFENLEDRLAPAIFTGTGPNLTIDLNFASEIAAFSTNGTTVTVALTNGTANSAATGGNVTGNGTAIATFLASVYTG